MATGTGLRCADPHLDQNWLNGVSQAGSKARKRLARKCRSLVLADIRWLRMGDFTTPPAGPDQRTADHGRADLDVLEVHAHVRQLRVRPADVGDEHDRSLARSTAPPAAAVVAAQRLRDMRLVARDLDHQLLDLQRRSETSAAYPAPCPGISPRWSISRTGHVLRRLPGIRSRARARNSPTLVEPVAVVTAEAVYLSLTQRAPASP